MVMFNAAMDTTLDIKPGALSRLRLVTRRTVFAASGAIMAPMLFAQVSYHEYARNSAPPQSAAAAPSRAPRLADARGARNVGTTGQRVERTQEHWRLKVALFSDANLDVVFDHYGSRDACVEAGHRWLVRATAWWERSHFVRHVAHHLGPMYACYESTDQSGPALVETASLVNDRLYFQPLFRE